MRLFFFTRCLAAAFVFAVAWLATGCQTGPISGAQEGDALPAAVEILGSAGEVGNYIDTAMEAEQQDVPGTLARAAGTEQAVAY